MLSSHHMKVHHVVTVNVGTFVPIDVGEQTPGRYSPEQEQK